MSYNPNFYSNFRPQHTFQRPNFIPPPPMPPAFYIPPITPQASDQDFVKQFDKVLNVPSKHKIYTSLSINETKQKLYKLIVTLKEIKDKEFFLKQNVTSISEEEWATKLTEAENLKAQINDLIANINDTHLDILRKLLAKRSAKRLRLKRVKQERKRDKEKRVKELEERSRKIDENLQKIKDDINKAKQEEEAKLQADIILRETHRKKHDAKKCISKLDALLKLYRARQNTARGRGENVSDRDAEVFSNNIDKLKSLWQQKLQLYEKEESDLQATLKQDSTDSNSASRKDAWVLENLTRWREFLFGEKLPQRDFQGDVATFISVRSQWDQYVNSEGTALPVGWVLPDFKDK